MKKPSEIITEKTLALAKKMEDEARAKNSALTREQLAVINVAALCEAIIMYLDAIHDQTLAKTLKPRTT